MTRRVLACQAGCVLVACVVAFAVGYLFEPRGVLLTCAIGVVLGSLAVTVGGRIGRRA